MPPKLRFWSDLDSSSHKRKLPSRQPCFSGASGCRAVRWSDHGFLRLEISPVFIDRSNLVFGRWLELAAVAPTRQDGFGEITTERSRFDPPNLSRFSGVSQNGLVGKPIVAPRLPSMVEMDGQRQTIDGTIVNHFAWKRNNGKLARRTSYCSLRRSVFH
jgi:hypothetical protein